MWSAHNTLPLCLHRSTSQDAIERSPCRLRSGDQPGWCDTSQAHRAALEVASRCGGPGGLCFLGVAGISPAAASHTSISGLTLTSATPGELVSTWDDPVKPRRRDSPPAMPRADGPQSLSFAESTGSGSTRSVNGEGLDWSPDEMLVFAVSFKPLWEVAESEERRINAAFMPSAGRKRLHTIFEAHLFAIAAKVTGGYRAADRNLSDPVLWERLARAVADAYPDNPDRRRENIRVNALSPGAQSLNRAFSPSAELR